MNNCLNFSFGFVALLVLTLFACEQTYPPLAITEEVTVPYAIVSVEQAATATEAVIELKLPNIGAGDFKVELLAKDGPEVPLKMGTDAVVANFRLRSYAASSLVNGASYTIKLTYRDTQNTEITISRNFTAQPPDAWKKLPHAPIFGGDYTGAAVLSNLFQSRIAVYQYFNETSWNVLKYSGTWENTESTNPQPRHGAILFELPYPGNSPPIFFGFGYLVNEKIPDKKGYLSDLWSVGNYFSLGRSSFQVFHGFGLLNAPVKFFTTKEEVFLLKENDVGTLYSMNYNWDEKKVQPLPEKTGTLTAFTIDKIGYVVNQLPGVAPHLYAYYPQRDQWERKANFPGSPRSEATGFSARGKGYFGLGMSEKGEGLRDVWEYDPAQNQWKYHSEYPGQGQRQLIAVSDSTQAYLGWGYENRPVVGTLARQQVGCTDFWEFFPLN